MVHWVKVPDVKAEDLSSILRTHMVKRENQLLQAVLRPPLGHFRNRTYTCLPTCVCTCVVAQHIVRHTVLRIGCVQCPKNKAMISGLSLRMLFLTTFAKSFISNNLYSFDVVYLFFKYSENPMSSLLSEI